MRICVKILNGSKRIVSVSEVIRVKKQHANLNPNLIFSGHLATILSNKGRPCYTRGGSEKPQSAGHPDTWHDRQADT